MNRVLKLFYKDIERHLQSKKSNVSTDEQRRIASVSAIFVNSARRIIDYKISIVLFLLFFMITIGF